MGRTETQSAPCMGLSFIQFHSIINIQLLYNEGSDPATKLHTLERFFIRYKRLRFLSIMTVFSMISMDGATGTE